MSFASGCDRSDPDAGPAETAARESRSTTWVTDSDGPADVVRRVHELRLRRRWFDLEEHLVSEQREPVRNLIVAMDSLLDANARMRKAIIESHGLAAAAPLDRSQAGNAIGVFSMEVTVLGQRIDDERAVVTIQVDDRVPVEEVELVRRGGHWLIRTDPPVEALPPQLAKLAGVMNEAAERMEREALTVDELTALLDTEQTPVLRRIARLTSDGS